MLSLAVAFTLPDHPGLALFADDRDPALVHVLPLTLTLLSPKGRFDGQLTVMGRGPAERPVAVTTGFWMVRLAPPPDTADRLAVAAALSTAERTVRLVGAEAAVTVTLTLAEGVSATRHSENWQGSALTLDGQVADATAAALLAAWRNGLPDAGVTLDLTLTGTTGPATLNHTTHRSALRFEPDATRRDTGDTRLNLTVRRTVSRHLRHRSALPGLTPALLRSALMLSGFDS